MSLEPEMRGSRWLMALAASIAMGAAAAGEPDAEYAVRWKSTEGGPTTLDKAAALLQVDGPPTVYSIRYFSSKKAAEGSAPVPILRERQSKKKTDVTWKYRSAVGWADLPGGAWCPLQGKTKPKDEIDVTVQEGDAVRRVYSRSCTTKASLDVALPAAIVGSQRGCAATMTRRESADESVTIEAWKLAGERAVFLEVSKRGADTPAALAAFRSKVVDKLLAAGAHPLDRSKTELGTECK